MWVRWNFALSQPGEQLTGWLLLATCYILLNYIFTSVTTDESLNNIGSNLVYKQIYSSGYYDNIG